MKPSRDFLRRMQRLSREMARARSPRVRGLIRENIDELEDSVVAARRLHQGGKRLSLDEVKWLVSGGI